LGGLALVALAACGGISESAPDDGSSGSTADSGTAGGDIDGSPRPVIDASPPVCQGGVTQLLTNPGFDEAMMPNGAIGWTEVPVPVTYPDPQLPIDVHSPTRAAWFGDVLRPEQRLFQSVAVPPETTSLSLGFFRCFVTDRTGGTPADEVVISLLDANGDPLETLAEYTNLDAAPDCGWSETVLIADRPHAGEEVLLDFHGLSHNTMLTSFYFDTLALNATGPCPDGGASGPASQ